MSVRVIDRSRVLVFRVKQSKHLGSCRRDDPVQSFRDNFQCYRSPFNHCNPDFFILGRVMGLKMAKALMWIVSLQSGTVVVDLYICL